MDGKIITKEAVKAFRVELEALERSCHTIWRYIHDADAFMGFLDGREVSAEETGGFKRSLIEKKYKFTSINTILESLFAFFKFMTPTARRRRS